MIQNRMKTYNVSTRISGQNEYGQPLETYETIGSADISISLLTKVINELDPRYLTSTHIGLTYDKSLKEGMRLVDADIKYMINVANNDGRLSQLTLLELI